MAKKLYAIEVDNEKLTDSAKSKAIKSTKSVAEKEVENFGIVEINNKSSKCKVKNTKDAGYEKNVTACAKRKVKSSVSKIDDYFDFSFKPTAQTKAEPVKVAEEKIATKTYSAKIETIEAEVKNNLVMQACDRFCIDDEAQKIVSVARMGSLFD